MANFGDIWSEKGEQWLVCTLNCWQAYVCMTFNSCCFMSKQHLRSYQDAYQLVTLRTHGAFIVLPHWETRPPAPWLSHLILTLSQPVLSYPAIIILQSAWLGSDKYKFWKSLALLDQCSNTVWLPQSPKMGDGCSTYSANPSGWHSTVTGSIKLT